MKKYLLIPLAVLLCACRYEPVVKTGAPSVQIDAESLSGYPGETITITGTAEDPAGLGGIILTVEAWNYTKTIDLAQYAPVSYSFSADVAIPESATAGARLEVSVTSAVSGSDIKAVDIILTEKPKPVVDTEAPVIILESPVEAKVGEPYAFSLMFSDDVGIIECWPKLHITKAWSDYPTVDGNAYDTAGYSLTVSGKETIVQYTLVFPSGGDYDVIVYDSSDGVSDGIHTLEHADDWSIAKFTISVARPESGDTEAPTIIMNSPETATLGEPYTLSLTFSDEGGMETSWPLVTVSCGDVMPQELVDNWNGWWPEVGGTEVTVEQALTFTAEGLYVVHIAPVTDLAGNASEDKDWFTITVAGGTPPPPTEYISVAELPGELTLSLVDGLASETFHLQGSLEGNTYNGITVDLYDANSWEQLVPYGCENTWDWGNWSMWDQPSYKIDLTITFDTAGYYYLYIAEKDINEEVLNAKEMYVTVE